eukprot:TRINITY_DN2710_c0_g1_i2.p1 TRINITY_DN2710_c0_g1~~TRINITY_DN2710_c0_g1_i2.p1  ORF type:complete len:868 (+),score=278.91 TRINITY_DN2710_c0_g1_i2:194-2605(+)
MAEILTKEKVPSWNKNPRLLVQRIENVTIAKKFFADHGLDTSDLDSQDFVRGNIKEILGLFWKMIAKYHLSDYVKDKKAAELEAEIAALQAEIEAQKGNVKDAKEKKRKAADDKWKDAFDKYQKWANSTVDAVDKDRSFGDTINEIKAYGKKLDDDEKEITSKNNSQTEELKKLYDAVTKLGGSKNPETMDNVNNLKKQVEDALKNRRKAYDDSLNAAEAAEAERLKREAAEAERLRRLAEEEALRRKKAKEAVEKAHNDYKDWVAKTIDRVNKDDFGGAKTAKDLEAYEPKLKKDEDDIAKKDKQYKDELKKLYDNADKAGAKPEGSYKDVETLSGKLKNAVDDRRKRFNKKLADEKEKERKKAEADAAAKAALDNWDKNAKAYEKWVNDTIADIKSGKFPSDPAALKELKKKIRAHEKEVRKDNQEKKDKLEGLWDAVEKSNPSITMTDVEKLSDDLEKALRDRRAALKAATKFVDGGAAYRDWADPVIEQLKKKDFGDSLDELEKYGKDLSVLEKKIGKENDEKKADLDKIWENLPLARDQKPDKSGVEKTHKDVRDALKQRRADYEQELANKRSENEKRKALERRKAKEEEAATPCKACGKPVKRSNVVLVDGVDLYHDTCFVCSEKDCKFEFTDFYWEYENKVYCFPHYAEVAGMYCPKCGKVIDDDEFVSAIGKKWHTDCFKCETCGCSFDNNFFSHEGKPYCKQDFFRVRGLLCARCDKPVGNGDKSALGKSWHKDCWHCTTCKKPFGSDGFFDFEGFPYCTGCYKQKKDSRQSKSGKSSKGKSSKSKSSRSSKKT